jgi:hypothetical protein
MQLFWDWIQIRLKKNGPQIGAEGVWLTMIFFFKISFLLNFEKYKSKKDIFSILFTLKLSNDRFQFGNGHLKKTHECLPCERKAELLLEFCVNYAKNSS